MIRIAAIILAAGQATRFRAQDQSIASKTVALLDGMPLVRHAANAALGSKARPVIAVTGHARADVEQALAGAGVACVHNPDFATGMASSLRAGVAALPDGIDGALIMLADMPRVTPALLDALIEKMQRNAGADAIIPVHAGTRGNPVLISRSLFERVAKLQGDEGARRILGDPALAIVELEAGEDAALDIDTPEALKAASASANS